MANRFTRTLRGFRDIYASQIRPFHDDETLQALVKELVEKLDISIFIETGTFRGDTLLWVAKNLPNLQAWSCEKKPLYYRVATYRASYHGNVHVKLQDSRDFLRELAVWDNPLFWLDAHWESDFPLLDELAIIFRKWDQTAILIDDFQIDGFPNFGFDRYDGRPINLEYVRPFLETRNNLWHDVQVFLPHYESAKELRGYCLILFGHEALKHNLPLVEVRAFGISS